MKKTKLHQIEKDKILKLIEEIGFDNDEGRRVKVDVRFEYPYEDDCLYLSIYDAQTSRRSQMGFMADHWGFNKNFWLTQRNLKLINAINEVLLDETDYDA